jgi:pimeloyl-ACP methyl ester carboxylesterase
MMIEVLGIPSHYEQYGTSGDEILLLHGWGVTLDACLTPLAKALQADCRVTALEFPAHGMSGKPAQIWGVPEFAAWVKAMMEALRLGPQTVIAHSFGGRVALWMAAHEPGLVKRLVLTGAAGLMPQKTAAQEADDQRYQRQKQQLEWLKALPLVSASLRRTCGRCLCASSSPRCSSGAIRTRRPPCGWAT